MDDINEPRPDPMTAADDAGQPRDEGNQAALTPVARFMLEMRFSRTIEGIQNRTEGEVPIRGRVNRLGVSGILLPAHRGIKRLRTPRPRWIELEPGKPYECAGTAFISTEHANSRPGIESVSIAVSGLGVVWDEARFLIFSPIDQPLERVVLRDPDGLVLVMKADDDWFDYACNHCGRFDVEVFSQWEGQLSAFCGPCFQRLRKPQLT